MNQTIERIPLKHIIVGEYQRDPSSRRVERIVSNFDPAKLGVLVVNQRREGVYAILDGQHRLSALRTLGFPDTNCLVLTGLSIEQEADYYRKQNENQAALTNYDLYLGGIVAGDPHYLMLKDTLGKFGYKASKHSAPKNVTAIAALNKITKMYGFDVLDQVFAYISAAWDGDSTAARREMLAGMAEFAARFGDKVTPEMFAKRMGMQIPGLLYYEYRRRSEGRATYRNAFNPLMRRLCCVVLMEAYNKGLNGTSSKRLRMED